MYRTGKATPSNAVVPAHIVAQMDPFILSCNPFPWFILPSASLMCDMAVIEVCGACAMLTCGRFRTPSTSIAKPRRSKVRIVTVAQFFNAMID